MELRAGNYAHVFWLDIMSQFPVVFLALSHRQMALLVDDAVILASGHVEISKLLVKLKKIL